MFLVFIQLNTFTFYKYRDIYRLHSTKFKMVKQQVKSKSQKRTKSRKVTQQYIKQMLRNKNERTKKIEKPIKRQKIAKIITQNMMTCPLCLQIMVTPVVTECGHNYCLLCIQEYYSNASRYRDNPKCSICRFPLQFYDYHYSSPLKVITQEYLSKLDKAKQDEYSIRQKKSDKYEKGRLFKQLEVGALIDYFDYNIGQWRDGEVCFIYVNKSGVKRITVEGMGQRDQQIMYYRYSINSKMIAPYRYFSKERQEEEEEEYQDSNQQ